MRHLSLLLLPLLVACETDGPSGTDDVGDSDDPSVALEGLYKVTSDAIAADCGTFVEQEIPLPYFSVVVVGDELEVWKCRATDDCDDFADLDFVFATGAEGWRNIRTWAYFNEANGGTCTYNARRTVLRDKAGGVVSLDSAEVAESVAAGNATDDLGCEAGLDDWTPAFSSDPYDCWSLAGKLQE